MIKIDMENGLVIDEELKGSRTFRMDSPEAFALISKAWLRCGWDNKYVYSFTWMGRPIIQLPDDMFRIQEVIYNIKPDILIETGVAHGGSLIFYAGLFKAMGRGKVIGIDIEIRPHNRAALEAHELIEYITLMEGSSIDNRIVSEVKGKIKDDDKVMVVLDSSHSKDHVLNELRAYAPLVTKGSYIVATDGIMHWLGNALRTNPDWIWNNPKNAVEEFLLENDDFENVPPRFAFNEGNITEMVTYWPGAWLKRK